MTSFRQISGIAAAILALQTGAAVASEFGPGHSGQGYDASKYGLKYDASLGYYDQSGDSEAGYYGKFSFGVPIGGNANSGSFGAQFGAYLELHTFGFSSFDETSFTGGLVFGGDRMQLIAGVPTAAAEDYVSRPAVAGTDLIDFLALDATMFVGTITELGQVGFVETNYGLRYDAQYDGFQFGASVHEFSDADISTATAGAQFATGNLLFGLGVEYVESSFTDQNSWFGSVGADFDMFDVGLYLQRQNSGGSNLTTVQLSGGFQPTDRISVDAQYMDIDSIASVYGVSAAYSLTDQISVNGGYLSFDGGSDIAFVELSILSY